MSAEPTLLRIGFREQTRLFGDPLLVLTALYQSKDASPPFNRVYELDATPGDLARAVERGWIRTGEQTK